MDETRLDRIEKKLDDVAIMGARIEERLKSSTSRIDRLEFRADEQEDDLEELKESVSLQGNFIKNSESFGWILLTAIISFILYMGK